MTVLLEVRIITSSSFNGERVLGAILFGNIMLKLTLPEEENFYGDCIAHNNVVRVVALSGGYSRDEANRRLALNNNMIASFSRALSEGLSAKQSDGEFNGMLDSSIQSIFDASRT
jgi:fructose-bisphosphate aldolase class I